VQQALGELGRNADTSRAYVFEFYRGTDGALLASQRFEWVAAGVPPQMDNPDLQDFPMLAGGFGRWVEAFEKGAILAGHVREFPETEQAVLAPQGIRSILVVPIVTDGRLWGFLGFDECRAERVWSEPKIDALRVAAHTLGAAIERQQTEEARRESEARYHSLVETLPQGIFRKDRDGRFTFVNTAFCKAIGRPADQLLGKTDRDFHPAELAAKYRQDDQRVMATGDLLDAIEENQIHGAETRYVHVIKTPLRDAAGRVEGVQGIFWDVTERKRAEEALAQTARVWQTTFDATKDAIWILDADQRVVRSNKAAEQYFRRPCSAMACRRCFEIAHGTTEPPPDCPFVRARANRRREQLVMLHGEAWIEVVVDPILDGAGQFVGATHVVSDITERKRAEEALRASEQQLRRAQGIAHLGSWHLDLVRNRLAWSDEVYRIFGLKPQEFGATYEAFLERVHPDDREKVDEAYSGSVRENRDSYGIEHRVVRKDTGEIRFVQEKCEHQRDHAGKIVSSSGTVLDITERKRADKQLAESELRLRQVWERALVPMRLADATGRVLMVNGAYSQLVGKPREELEGQPLALAYESARHEQIQRDYVARFQEGGSVWERAAEVTFWDGRRASMEVSESFLALADGRTALLTTLHDVTARKQAEAEREKLQAQLTQAQKMESVGRLAGGVAHDFNNLLMGIMNYVELCRDELAPGHAARGYLDEIMGGARRSANLTRQLLAFARKQAIAPQVLDLNQVVAGSLKLMGRLIGEDIELVHTPGADLWPVRMDPGQADQLVANLCVNARDAIAGAGKITIVTANTTLDAEHCAAHPGTAPGDYVRLAVSDSGCGMTPEVLERVFEPFFTTKETGKGTGLGLATVYGIVTQNHGAIDVKSEPGQGTTFSIYLPRSRPQAEAEERRPKVAAAPTTGGETILLAEDEKSLRKTIGLYLERFGYKVLAAESPRRPWRWPRSTAARFTCSSPMWSCRA
jgi:PAS domain S-box-containing protein